MDYFFETRHLGQMLLSIGLYCHAKNQKNFLTLDPRIKIFFHNYGHVTFLNSLNPNILQNFTKI